MHYFAFKLFKIKVQKWCFYLERPDRNVCRASHQTSFHFIDWQPAKVTSSYQSGTSLYMVTKKCWQTALLQLNVIGEIGQKIIYQLRSYETFFGVSRKKCLTFTHCHLPLLDVFQWPAASRYKNFTVTACRKVKRERNEATKIHTDEVFKHFCVLPKTLSTSGKISNHLDSRSLWIKSAQFNNLSPALY